MKILIAFLILSFTLSSYAQDNCQLTEVGAKAMAELFVLKNKEKIEPWVPTENLAELAEKVSSNPKFSSDRNSYFFDIITIDNNGGPYNSGAWLEASCFGVHLNYQLID